MKVTLDRTTTRTIHRRVIHLENGPIVEGGGLNLPGVEFTVDQITYEWNDGHGPGSIVLKGWEVGPMRSRVTRIVLPSKLPQRLLDFITNPKDSHHDD